MKWPRGKYNGQRIIGFKIKLRFLATQWKIRFQWSIVGRMFQIGPVQLWFELEYSFS